MDLQTYRWTYKCTVGYSDIHYKKSAGYLVSVIWPNIIQPNPTYRFLTLDYLTFPLVVSIPVFAAVGQITIWNYFGTLCEQQVAMLYLFKADLDVELASGVDSLPVQLRIIVILFILGLEVFMRIKKAKINIIFRNQVAPLNTPNAQEWRGHWAVYYTSL